MKLYGLFGKSLAHSFSQSYFRNKFKIEKINADYLNFESASAEQILDWIEQNPELAGLNVTIPYKTEVLRFVHESSQPVSDIGAANCLIIERNRNNFRIITENTDFPAFTKTVKPLLKAHHKRVLILGTGGAARTVDYALRQIPQITEILKVSIRHHPEPKAGSELKSTWLLSDYDIVINCTPAGMYPDVNRYPEIPYHQLRAGMLLYDLIYNPEETTFLRKGRQAGCVVKNGMEMLILQAELSWRQWNP